MLSKMSQSKLKVQSYTEWKNKLLMWTLVCGYVKKEQGIILSQSLSENQKAKNVVIPLTLTDLNKEDGLNILLNKLDELFKTEQTQDSYYN